jgi:hypothetical protein
MGLPMRMPTTVAWVVVALMVALAPLFHAICIAPAETASATHVMADGTVMTVASPADHAGQPVEAVESTAATAATAVTALTSPGMLANAMPATGLLDAAEVVIIVVALSGLAVLSLVGFARRCRMLLARSIPPRRGPAAAIRRDVCAWSSTDVDLRRLGISRT